MQTKEICGECSARIVVLPSKHLKAEITWNETSNQTVSDLDKKITEIKAVYIAFVRFVRSNKYIVTRHPSGGRNYVYCLTKIHRYADNSKNIIEYYIDIAFILAGLKPLDEIIVND